MLRIFALIFFAATAFAQEKIPLSKTYPDKVSFVLSSWGEEQHPKAPETEPAISYVENTFRHFAFHWSASLTSFQHLGYEMKYGYSKDPRLALTLPAAYEAIAGFKPFIIHDNSGIRASAHFLNLFDDPYRQWVIAGLRAMKFVPVENEEFRTHLPAELQQYSRGIIANRVGRNIYINLGILQPWQKKSNNSVDGIEDWIVLEALKIWLTDGEHYDIFYARYLDTLADLDFSPFDVKDANGKRMLAFMDFTEQLQAKVQKLTQSNWNASVSLYRQTVVPDGIRVQFIAPTLMEVPGTTWKSNFLTQYISSNVDAINNKQMLEINHATLWCDDLEPLIKAKKKLVVQFKPQLGAVMQNGTKQVFAGITPWKLALAPVELNSPDECEAKLKAAVETAQQTLFLEFSK